MERALGRSGIPVSAMGMGCWAIGGAFLLDGKPDGYGPVDDAESIRTIRRALDVGVTLFDTSDAYGTGHSEELLGEALAGRRHQAVIATKFGWTHDAERRELTGTDVTPGYIRQACEASLRRLRTDVIDLYQLHVWPLPPEAADVVFDTLDDLRTAGRIRAYGWSTEDPRGARQLAARAGAAAIQHPLNVMADASELLSIAGAAGLATIANGPLAMGLLTGKFDANARLPRDDVRGAGHAWVAYFEDGRPKPELLARVAAVREILTSGGRTLAQGALAWIWGRGSATIAIPGCKSVRQVEENAGAMAFGPLTPGQMAEVDRLLGRGPGATAGASTSAG